MAALRETLKNGTVEQIKAGMDELQKAVYAASEKLYQQTGAQAGGPDMGGQQPGGNAGGDGQQYYDADYEVVDDDKK